MVKQQRWKIIIDLCQNNKKVYNEDLKIACKTSIATVRRDLQQMEDLKLVQRFHGGVTLILMLMNFLWFIDPMNKLVKKHG